MRFRRKQLPRPRRLVFRVHPNDALDPRPYPERLAEVYRIAALGAVRRAEHQRRA